MNTNLLLKNLNISSIMKNTSNTLNVIKKIIPIYKEVRPYFNHEKSLFIEEKKESNSSTNKPVINDNLTFFN